MAKDPKKKADQRDDVLTVGLIRDSAQDNVREVLFHESPLVIRASKEMDSLSILEEALEKNEPVSVSFHAQTGELVKAQPLDETEKNAFKDSRSILPNANRTRKIDLATIDPTTFNIVGKYLKSRSFDQCNKIVPNYSKAKEIFDFCATQSCGVSSTTLIKPCITFQYLKDGCYARAHKMRQIIDVQFKYCCEKVFCYANEPPDTLAVRAEKYGGCCVKWWWHVAPLVRVCVRKVFSVAMVIDPGIFDRPVLLSTWMTALVNKGCDPNANFSTYAIQSGEAYGPTNLAGTQYMIDPGYAMTDKALESFAGLETCTKTTAPVA